MRTRILCIASLLALSLCAVLYLVDHRYPKICVTPTALDVPWELHASNVTTFAFTSSDPGWFAPGAAVGMGERCVVVAMSSGDVIKINGLFHSNPQYWLYMLDAVNAKRVTVDGQEVGVSSVSWGHGSDGQFVAP